MDPLYDDPLISATCDIAMNGLYMTVDMEPFAHHVDREAARKAADRLHRSQPQSIDYDAFATVVNERYLSYSDLLHNPICGARVVMAGHDLACTYRQIRRAMFAAADALSAVMARNNGAPDDLNDYPRIIPTALDGLTIRTLDDLTEDVVLRVLTTEPWVGWMEKLRAQRARTREVFENDDVLHFMRAAVTKARAKLESWPRRLGPDRRLKKRTRRSADLFVRHLGRDRLQQFLRSSYRDPLRLQGCRYNYELVIYKTTLLSHGSNLNSGVCSFHLGAYDKGGGWICDLCHLFPNTPPLDDVLATALHVQNARLEMDFLRAASITSASPRFYADDTLPAMKGLHRPEQLPTMISGIMFHALGGVLAAHVADVRSAVCTHGYRLLSAINHLPAQYLPLMREASRFSPVDLITADPESESDALWQQVRRACLDGSY